ncbi:MAG: hypothetical protein ACYTGP_11450 [Planctomycetota bacterium]|jgi:hypothetical protein
MTVPSFVRRNCVLLALLVAVFPLLAGCESVPKNVYLSKYDLKVGSRAKGVVVMDKAVPFDTTVTLKIDPEHAATLGSPTVKVPGGSLSSETFMFTVKAYANDPSIVARRDEAIRKRFSIAHPDSAQRPGGDPTELRREIEMDIELWSWVPVDIEFQTNPMAPNESTNENHVDLGELNTSGDRMTVRLTYNPPDAVNAGETDYVTYIEKNKQISLPFKITIANDTGDTNEVDVEAIIEGEDESKIMPLGISPSSN